MNPSVVHWEPVTGCFFFQMLPPLVSIKKLPCDQFKSIVQSVHGKGTFLFT